MGRGEGTKTPEDPMSSASKTNQRWFYRSGNASALWGGVCRGTERLLGTRLFRTDRPAPGADLQSGCPTNRSQQGETSSPFGPPTFIPTVVSKEPGKRQLGLIPTPQAVLKGRSGLLSGLTEPALALCLLGFYKGPDLLSLTLICLAGAAENQ